MRNGVLRTGMTLLLSATVFLGAVMPPAVQHAHANGDQTHNHDAVGVKEHADSHHHQHAHPHRHSHQAGRQENSVRMPTRHTHLTFFGWDFHLPVKNSQSFPNQAPSIPGHQAETLVRLLDLDVVLVSAPVVDWLLDRLAGVSSIATVDVDTTNLRIGWVTTTSPPLCDSARGERSGVQLI